MAVRVPLGEIFEIFRKFRGRSARARVYCDNMNQILTQIVYTTCAIIGKHTFYYLVATPVPIRVCARATLGPGMVKIESLRNAIVIVSITRAHSDYHYGIVH